VKWLNGYRMRLVLVGIVAVMVLGGESAKADFTWTQKADMPTARMGPTSAVVNGKIYIIGGGTSEGPDERVLSTVEEYDPVTETWTRKADMPTARGWMSPSSAVVDGKIYVIGGWNGRTISTVEVYDPATDTWTRKADMLTGRDCTAMVALDGKIYAIGGAVGGYLGRSIVEQCDPVTDTWTRKADMPTYLWGLCANVVNGKIYAFGGRSTSKARSDMFEYDPVTDTWTGKADMPLATSEMASVVLGDKIIVIGGWIWSQRFPYQTVQMYDPAINTWTREADVPFQRVAFSADVVRGKIFAIGGTDRPHPCPATSTVYEFGPILDFNGDGIVGVEDVVILTDHWGEDYSLCDIGPTPLGDGIVDAQDLIVLAEYIEPIDRTLTAHWALDETEGMFVTDSAGGNNGYALGNPSWQPDGGRVNGALEFDGVDDFISTPAPLNAADGPFSVFVWVKGGAAGQAIISEPAGPDWLSLDPLTGGLMTGLMSAGSSGGPLSSQAAIDDGDWHRIGFVWDGSPRTLYVDGIAVADDTQDGLENPGNGFYIGVGNTMAPGTFFSGLIDDIRIYNRAVSP